MLGAKRPRDMHSAGSSEATIVEFTPGAVTSYFTLSTAIR